MTMDFDKLQQTLSAAIATSRLRDAESLSDKQSKLPLSDAFFCGEDTLKNKRFYEALMHAIKDIQARFPNEKIRVVDAGSGTGVLGALALIAWADYVSFIEANPYTLSWSQKFIEKLWLSDRSEFYCEDATEIVLPEKYHLLISETITIDFTREDFHNIINHLKQFILPEAIIIPEAFDINFTQKMQDNTIVQHETISRNSLWHLGQHIELIQDETQILEISGEAQIYGNTYISSGETMSFFNTMSYSRDDISDIFVWAK